MQANEIEEDREEKWEDDIEEWLNMSVAEAGRLAENRAAYRAGIWATTSQGISYQKKDVLSDALMR